MNKDLSKRRLPHPDTACDLGAPPADLFVLQSSLLQIPPQTTRTINISSFKLAGYMCFNTEMCVPTPPNPPSPPSQHSSIRLNLRIFNCNFILKLNPINNTRIRSKWWYASNSVPFGANRVFCVFQNGDGGLLWKFEHSYSLAWSGCFKAIMASRIPLRWSGSDFCWWGSFLCTNGLSFCGSSDMFEW